MDKHCGKQIRISPVLYERLMELKTENESVRDVIQKLIHLYKISKELTK
jgi:predicted CopG family antitoxin